MCAWCTVNTSQHYMYWTSLEHCFQINACRSPWAVLICFMHTCFAWTKQTRWACSSILKSIQHMTRIFPSIWGSASKIAHCCTTRQLWTFATCCGFRWYHHICMRLIAYRLHEPCSYRKQACLCRVDCLLWMLGLLVCYTMTLSWTDYKMWGQYLNLTLAELWWTSITLPLCLGPYTAKSFYVDSQITLVSPTLGHVRTVLKLEKTVFPCAFMDVFNQEHAGHVAMLDEAF